MARDRPSGWGGGKALPLRDLEGKNDLAPGHGTSSRTRGVLEENSRRIWRDGQDVSWPETVFARLRPSQCMGAVPGRANADQDRDRPSGWGGGKALPLRGTERKNDLAHSRGGGVETGAGGVHA